MRFSSWLSFFPGARCASPLLAAALLLGAAGCGNVLVEGGGGDAGSGGAGGSVSAGGGDAGGGDAGGGLVSGAGCAAKSWGRGFADSYSYEYGESIALDAACNVLVAGSFGGTMDLGGAKLTGQDEDLFLVKLDGEGHHVWSKSFGTEPFQGSARVAVDPSGDVYLAGTFDGTVDFGTGPLVSKQEAVYVAKFDPSGHALWAHAWSSGQETVASSIAVGLDGSALVSGYFTGAVDFGTGLLGGDGLSRAYAVKLDADGHTRWATALSGDGARANGVAVDEAGDVVLAGRFHGSMQAGKFTLVGAGTSAFVVRLGPDGSVFRATTIGGTGDCDAAAVAMDPSGFAYVAGTFDGTVDFGNAVEGAGSHATTGDWDGFVVAYEPNGSIYWGRTFGGPSTDSVAAIAAGPDYSVAITGSFIGTVDFDGDTLTSFGPQDGFVAFVAGNHTFGDARRFGGSSGGGDNGLAVAIGPDGSPYVTGTYQGETDFGSGTTDSAGGIDVFVAKYKQ
jgi:hypothetical protein